MAKDRIAFNRAHAQSPFSFSQTILLKDAWRLMISALKANTIGSSKPSVTHELLWAEACRISLQDVLVLQRNRTPF